MPSVSLVISVYNEEKVLPEKMKNVLALDYPLNLLEIAVISDGSTDKTNDIIQNYARQDQRVRPCIAPNNQGKTACLNDFVPTLVGDIVLFTDANSFYEKDLVHKIVRSFADKRVGFVTGSTKYFSSVGGKQSNVNKIYSKLEKISKRLESKINSCIGADGAIFAIRKGLYSPMNLDDINDFVLPLMIIQAGYRGVIDEEAFCHEETAKKISGEFKRQVRITNRTLRALFRYNHMLNPFHYKLFAFELLSHKLMKFIVPFLMIAIFITNCILAYTSMFYAGIFFLQLFYYFVTIFAHSQKKFFLISNFSSIAYSFSLMNLAILQGWITYFSGKTYSSWTPERP